jgi:hypothetical protein
MSATLGFEVRPTRKQRSPPCAQRRHEAIAGAKNAGYFSLEPYPPNIDPYFTRKSHISNPITSKMAVLDYFNLMKAKKENIAKSPILNDEDEKFLNKITSEDQPPPLPERPMVIFDNGKKVEGKDAQTALMDGADAVPLPTSPPAEVEGSADGSKAEDKKGHDYWAYIRNVPMQLPTFKVHKISLLYQTCY